jgi:hypothetical protein
MLTFILSTVIALFLGVAIVVYTKYPLHLIYKSKIGLQEMIDGIDEPLAVISSHYIIKRANKSRLPSFLSIQQKMV